MQSINNKPKTVKDQIRQIIKKPKEKFLTFSQKEYWEILEKNQITLCFGPAGTGKSHISIKKARALICTCFFVFENLRTLFNKIILSIDCKSFRM